jgi:hypothetical protein
MKKLAVLSIVSLLLAAASSQASETGRRKQPLRGVQKARLVQPPVKPVNLPIPVDTFRA